jgi:hypothetical protein
MLASSRREKRGFRRKVDCSVKRKFTSMEDQQLAQLVQKYGSEDWKVISNLMGTRSVRQCRERWRNYMDPVLTMKSWTAVEEERLLQRYEEVGPRWSVIRQAFPNRSVNNVRNQVVKLLRSRIHIRRKDVTRIADRENEAERVTKAECESKCEDIYDSLCRAGQEVVFAMEQEFIPASLLENAV